MRFLSGLLAAFLTISNASGASAAVRITDDRGASAQRPPVTDTVGDIVETFKIQLVAPPSNERIVTDFQRQITMLEERNGDQVAQISALRREIAELKGTQ